MLSPSISQAEIEETKFGEQMAEGLLTKEPEPINIWRIDKFKELFLSTNKNDLIDPAFMPQGIDVGNNFVEYTQSVVNQCCDDFYGDPHWLLTKSPAYLQNRYKLSDDRSIRVLAYKAGNKVSNVLEYCYPPRAEYLMPLLSYTEYMSGRARAITLASDEIMLLAIRTSKTYLLTGDIEPHQNRSMKMPYSFRPGLQQSMRSFLTACTEAHLAVYARKTFPIESGERGNSLLSRIV